MDSEKNKGSTNPLVRPEDGSAALWLNVLGRVEEKNTMFRHQTKHLARFCPQAPSSYLGCPQTWTAGQSLPAPPSSQAAACSYGATLRTVSCGRTADKQTPYQGPACPLTLLVATPKL